MPVSEDSPGKAGTVTTGIHTSTCVAVLGGASQQLTFLSISASFFEAFTTSADLAENAQPILAASHTKPLM